MTKGKKPKSKPPGAKKRSRDEAWLDTQIKSWLQSLGVDEAADYANRGRAHAGLSDDELVARWKAAFRAYAANPLPDSPEAAAHRDLTAEFQLRGREPPFAEVEEDAEKFIRAVDQIISRVKAEDPAAWEAKGDSVARDLEEFIARRDKSKS